MYEIERKTIAWHSMCSHYTPVRQVQVAPHAATSATVKRWASALSIDIYIYIYIYSFMYVCVTTLFAVGGQRRHRRRSKRVGGHVGRDPAREAQTLHCIRAAKMCAATGRGGCRGVAEPLCRCALDGARTWSSWQSVRWFVFVFFFLFVCWHETPSCHTDTFSLSRLFGVDAVLWSLLRCVNSKPSVVLPSRSPKWRCRRWPPNDTSTKPCVCSKCRRWRPRRAAQLSTKLWRPRCKQKWKRVECCCGYLSVVTQWR